MLLLLLPVSLPVSLRARVGLLPVSLPVSLRPTAGPVSLRATVGPILLEWTCLCSHKGGKSGLGKVVPFQLQIWR